MSKTTSPVRVRFAPSPTGYLHVGSVRTVIFNWLLARHTGGTFVWRIEDTDRERLVPGVIETMRETVRWLGVEWDEGPEVGGPYGPYVQSERLSIYREHADRLLEEGRAYRCYCSPERLAELRAEQQRAGLPTGYDRRCRDLSDAERAELEASGTPSAIRFRTPLDGTTTMVDALRGPITYENASLDDFIILKSDGYPVYHFGVVVDDYLMKITHVLRGQEYLSAGAKDILLHDALGISPPVYVHLPLVLAPDRSRLSKRHGAVAALEFRDLGYVPEALFNYLALLGAAYSGDREIYSREELIELFDIDRLNPASAVFDHRKLEWMNGYYINHALTLPDLADRCLPLLRDAGLVTDETPREYVEQVVGLVKDRIKLLPEVVELTSFFFTEPSPAPDEIAGRRLTPEEALPALERARERLEAVTEWSDEPLESAMRSLAEELGMKTGALFMSLRVAITGRTVSPGLFETMRVLGRDTTLARLSRAVDALSGVAA